MKRVLIIGGGVIGLSSAYFLMKAGHDVTVIDRFDFKTNCSVGNAGLIVPSHFIPLAAPGVIWQGMKWMTQPSSPFAVNISFNKTLLKWGIDFWTAANTNHVRKSAPHLLALSEYSKKLYKEFHFSKQMTFDYDERGLLVLFQKESFEKEEREAVNFANKIGVKASYKNRDQVREMEPLLKINARGGVYFPNDANITPYKYLSELITYLQHNGATLLDNQVVTNINFHNDHLSSVTTEKDEIYFDELVIAAGAWSQELFDRLNINIQVIAGKGYSFNQPANNKLHHPLILKDAGVAITPFKNQLRFAGTMTLGDQTDRINHHKIHGMKDSIHSFLPDLMAPNNELSKTWYGLRPCSPDGLPYIGRVKKYRNLVLATGHAMMGVSLAPATGKIVEQIISGSSSDIDINPFSPMR